MCTESAGPAGAAGPAVTDPIGAGTVAAQAASASTVPSVAARPAGPAIADQPGCPAAATNPARTADGVTYTSDATGPTTATTPEQFRRASGSAGPTHTTDAVGAGVICASGTADPTGPTATDQPTGTAGPSVPTDTGNAGALQEPSPGTAGPTGPTVAVEQPAVSASPAISADPAVPNWCGSGTTVAAGPAIAPQPGVSPVPSGSAIRSAFSAENLIIQPGVTTAAAIAEKQPTMSAVTTGPLHRPHREETGTPGIAAIAAGSAVTPQPSVATRTTNPARRVVSPSGGPA